MSTQEEKIVRAISQVLGRTVEGTKDTLLKEDLGMSSLNLVELTVAMHTLWGLDIGRRAVERKASPRTIGDIATLMEPV